jgi:pyruvate dehydrogenase (quinone)
VHHEGYAKDTLQALIPLLKRKQDRSWRQVFEEGVAEWWRLMDARARNTADPINPQYIFWELSKRLPDRCILSADSGTTAAWFARDLKIRSGMMASLSGNLATMCPGVPYTVAAKFAHPDRVPIGLIGDGAFQMLGMNEMITVAKYWKEWEDPRLIILVLKNKDLNMVSWEQRVMAGDTRFEDSQSVPDFDYAGYARLLGLEGFKAEKPEEVPAALDAAMAARKPVILDIAADPTVPPLPPHITVKEAGAFMSAILKGDSQSWRMIRQTYKDVIDAYLPGK